MTYLAGQAEALSSGNAAAFARYQTGIENYPQSYHSYLGLIELVEAGETVDDYQRALIDYYAGAYEPCQEAIQRVLENHEAQQNGRQIDSHLLLAWCQEGLGDLEAALAALDDYAVENQAEASLARAEMLLRAGLVDETIAAYTDYLVDFPEGPDAPQAVWWLAALNEQKGDVETAVAHYQALAANYPRHEDAPEALYRAGWLANGTGDLPSMATMWHQAATDYPGSPYGAASFVWLWHSLPQISPTQRLTDTQTIPHNG